MEEEVHGGSPTLTGFSSFLRQGPAPFPGPRWDELEVLGLEQWFLNMPMCQNQLQALLKHRLLGPSLRISHSLVQGGVQNFHVEHVPRLC